MKNLKYLFLSLSVSLLGCVEDTAPEDAYGNTPNIASFSSTSTNLSVVASGDEFIMDVPVRVKGPSYTTITSPVTITVEVDEENTTAIEGVHYRLDNPTVTIPANNNGLGLFPVTVLTEGLEPPLAETPVISLKVVSVSGADNVIANGKPITVNLLYLCSSELAGTYTVTLEYWRYGAMVAGYPITFTDVVNSTGDGEYRTGRVGHWAAADLGGNPGFTFIDVCDELTIPEQNLVDLYSNLVEGDAGKSYVNDDGSMHMEYTVCATDCRQYYVDYVPQ